MSVELTREQLAGVRAVSFDLDGTLYELPAMKRAVRWLAIGRAWRPLRVAGELRRLLRARAAYQQAREAGGDLSALPGIDSPEVLRALEARWWVPAIGAAGPRAGIPELLEALGASGLPLVVCSDHEGQGKLEALGLARRFQALYAGETLGALKPSPRVLEAALEALGLE
ncbi:MAG: HAD family hydrolase, partial [Planctomycetes bacterium]|nr:HAD family hydrolase [Planctomycetota bacterium]